MKKMRLCLLAVFAAVLTGCGPSQEVRDSLESGMTALENGEYAQAKTYFEQVADAGEYLTEAYRGQGIACMGENDLEGAVTAFDQALANTDDKMKQTRKDLFYYKASALYKEEDYSGASAVCDEILKLENEGQAHYMKGACLLIQGDRENAATEFKAAATLCPEDYEMLLDIYECYDEQDLSAEGDTYLQQALNIQGSGPDTAYQKGRIYYYLGEYDNAKAMLASAVENEDADCLLLMGRVYLKLDDTSHARVMYQNYGEKYGETPESINGLVLCDIAEGSYDSALSNIERGLALDGEKGKQELAFNAIAALEKKGDFASAKEKAVAYVQEYPADEKGQREYEFLQSR